MDRPIIEPSDKSQETRLMEDFPTTYENVIRAYEAETKEKWEDLEGQDQELIFNDVTEQIENFIADLNLYEMIGYALTYLEEIKELEKEEEEEEDEEEG